MALRYNPPNDQKVFYDTTLLVDERLIKFIIDSGYKSEITSHTNAKMLIQQNNWNGTPIYYL